MVGTGSCMQTDMEYAKAICEKSLGTSVGTPFLTIESVHIMRSSDWVVDVTSLVLSSAEDGKAKYCPLPNTWRGQSAVVILKLQKKPAFQNELLRSLERSQGAESGHYNFKNSTTKNSCVVPTSTGAVSGPSNSELLP